MTLTSTPLITLPPLRAVDGPLAIRQLLDQQSRVRDSRPAVEAPDEIRRQYNRSLAFVSHEALERVHESARLWMDFNAGRPPARFIGLEGPFFHGKSDIGLSLVMKTSQAVWRSIGDRVQDDEGKHTVIPAVWVVGGGTTGELDVLGRLMHFMGLPAPQNRRVSVTSVLTELAQACRRSRTQLIVIDDAHQFPAARGAAFTKFLKQCYEMLPATLMFIAKDLDETYILKPSGSDRANQEAAEQLQKRIVREPCGPVMLDDDQGARSWASLVDTCLNHFVLLRAEALPVEDIFWLHQVTLGNPAELIQTLIVAGTMAVGSSECVSRAELRAAHRIVASSRKP